MLLLTEFPLHMEKQRVASVLKKDWKMRYIPAQGKVKEFHFLSRKFRKKCKTQGIIRDFKDFPKEVDS